MFWSFLLFFYFWFGGCRWGRHKKRRISVRHFKKRHIFRVARHILDHPDKDILIHWVFGKIEWIFGWKIRPLSSHIKSNLINTSRCLSSWRSHALFLGRTSFASWSNGHASAPCAFVRARNCMHWVPAPISRFHPTKRVRPRVTRFVV